MLSCLILLINKLKAFIFSKFFPFFEIFSNLGGVVLDDDPAEGSDCVRDVGEVVVEEAGSLTTNTIHICKDHLLTSCKL